MDNTNVEKKERILRVEEFQYDDVKVVVWQQRKEGSDCDWFYWSLESDNRPPEDQPSEMWSLLDILPVIEMLFQMACNYRAKQNLHTFIRLELWKILPPRFEDELAHKN